MVTQEDVMDKVFPKGPDLTDQPIGNPDIEYFTDASSLSRMAHALLGMQW
jgi:hypothetical protein